MKPGERNEGEATGVALVENPHLITISTTVIVETTYNISGALPVKRPYTSIQIIPEEVAVVVADGTWRSVVVAGPIAEKDGTPSQRYGQARFHAGINDHAVPQWARRLFEQGSL